MDIGDGAEAHARKLVLVAYLLVWHETRDDLGEFGGWKWDGLPVRLVAESPAEAKRLKKLPPGRDRVMFLWLGFDKRSIDPHVEANVQIFTANLEKAIPLVRAPQQSTKTVPNNQESTTMAFDKCDTAILKVLRESKNLLLIFDIVEAAGYERGTIGDHLSDLEKRGLVHRPKGERKGWAVKHT